MERGLIYEWKEIESERGKTDSPSLASESRLNTEGSDRRRGWD